MQCPHCGYAIADNQAAVCPNCGRYLSTAAMPENPDHPTWQGTAGTPPSYPGYPTYPSSYGWPSMPSQGYPGYGQPGMPSQGYPGYPSSYGQPGAPSQGYPVYPGVYGQPGMPSQGFPGYPGYPGGYEQPGLPPVPAAPTKNSQAGVIVSVLLAAVVIAGLLAAGLIALSRPQTTTANNPNSGTSTVVSGGTSTPGLSPIFTDPLLSNANGWPSDQHCFFGAGGYHIKGGWICYAPTDVPNNFTIQVQVKRVSGPVGDGYGIAFRRVSQGSLYLFGIDGYGHWRVDKCVSNSCSPLANWSPSGGAIRTALNSENTLEVDAHGSHFDFFANGTKIGQLNDSTFSSGSCGLAGGSSTEVVFSSLVINQIM
jgi:hypothetical protein